jgi:hypothetical protein
MIHRDIRDENAQDIIVTSVVKHYEALVSTVGLSKNVGVIAPIDRLPRKRSMTQGRAGR